MEFWANQQCFDALRPASLREISPVSSKKDIFGNSVKESGIPSIQNVKRGRCRDKNRLGDRMTTPPLPFFIGRGNESLRGI